MSYACFELFVFIYYLKDLMVFFPAPTPLYADNKSAIRLMTNPEN